MFTLTLLLTLMARGQEVPAGPTLAEGSSLAPAQEAFDDQRLVFEPTQHALTEAGVPWVARFGDGSGMNSVELLRALNEPTLDLQFTRRQRRSTAIGTTGFVVGTSGLLVGSTLILASVFPCWRESGCNSEANAVIGSGFMLGGLALDSIAMGSFVRHARRAKHPATWLDRVEAERRVAEYNAALAAELGLNATP